jgi:hypothetical protein
MGPDAIVPAGFNKPPVVDTKVAKADLIDVKEYGYSVWFRYITNFPSVMPTGKDKPWYIVARLTN